MRASAEAEGSVREDWVADLLARPTISVEEAAVLLSIGRRTAYTLAREGRLPGALYLGRRIVVRSRVLARCLGIDAPEVP